MPDTSHWITKVEAAGLIGVSTKTIESFANAGKLKSETRARPGKPPITVYDPKSVEKLRKAREPEILPAIAAPASVPIRHSDRYAPGIQWAPKTAVDDVSKPSEPSAPPPKNFPMAAAAASLQLALLRAAAMRLYVSLPEAAMLTGLPKAMIHRWVREGKMSAVKTGAGWRIKNENLSEVESLLTWSDEKIEGTSDFTA